jgi:UDP-N-acetylglucosamine--N-acetylmuramyl-(pentapeptide) pyrophosphoryl-undecaprenol N-acetylglucosamine transferase
MKLLLAGGGTAGHVEPALAVARAWKQAHPADEICFIGTSSGLENSLVPAAGFTLTHIPKVTIARSLSPSLLTIPFRLIQSILATIKILKDVDCAIGFGGYVSAPLYIAAALTRTPFVIHEQNAHPGWANKMGAHFTSFTAVSYPVARGRLASAELTGLPLRDDVLAALESATGDASALRATAKSEVAARYELDSTQPLIFIFGGSQGSQAINSVIERYRASATGFSILHGVGKNNPLPDDNPAYKANAYRAVAYRAVAYIEDMAQCYLAADLLISRSGAVTCAEAGALARFSLFIPLPIGNGEQRLNAQSLVAAGRAQLIDQSEFTPEWLVANVGALLKKSAAQTSEVDASGSDAVDKIVRIIERAAGVQ